MADDEPADRCGSSLPVVTRTRRGAVPIGDETGTGDGRTVAFLIDGEHGELAETQS